MQVVILNRENRLHSFSLQEVKGRNRSFTEAADADVLNRPGSFSVNILCIFSLPPRVEEVSVIKYHVSIYTLATVSLQSQKACSEREHVARCE